jgi:hypothetical protein
MSDANIFLKDDIEADDWYFSHIPLEDIIGILRLETTGIPSEAWKVLLQPAYIHLQDKTRKMFDDYKPQVLDIVDNPPECINDELLYQAMQYHTRAGGQYLMQVFDLIPDSLRERFNLRYPTDFSQKLEELKNIPRCHG